MIKYLKLQKAVYAVVLGVVALIVAQVVRANNGNGANFILGLSGALFMVGSALFLYPILFAKKTQDHDGEVELTPLVENKEADSDMRD